MDADAHQALLENTMIARAMACASNVLDNVSRCQRTPHACDMGRPLEGQTAYIVGAGPSLDKNIGELRNRGGVVFAVNSSAGALDRAGIPIDVLVSIESVPLSKHVADIKPRLYAWEMSCHPETIDAVEAPGCWFTSQSPEVLEICENINTPPICHCGAAIPAAAALAYRWGASSIVLVGVDLAFSGGMAYAHGSGWDGLEVKHTKGAEGEDRMQFVGREDRDAIHDAAGITRVPRNRPAQPVPAWGGEGTVSSVADYLTQLRFLEDKAKDWVDIDLVNATEGGAHIDGWAETALRDTHDRGDTYRPWHAAQSTPPPAFDVEALRQGLRDYARIGQQVYNLEPLGGLAGRGNGIGETMLTPTLLRMKRAKLPILTRIESGYAAMGELSEVALGKLEGL